MLSFWTFSDVFEEGGPAQRPFQGQFGLRATGGINKPSFYDFALLHQLGNHRIANSSHNTLVTRLADGSLEIALWNLVSVDAPAQSISTHHVVLRIVGVAANATVSMQQVDEDHGDVMKAYAAMGRPRYPSLAQVQQMNVASAVPAPQHLALRDGILNLDLKPNELALLHVDGASAAHSEQSSIHPQE
jgi:xylan 1,4-beta-xylosidase